MFPASPSLTTNLSAKTSIIFQVYKLWKKNDLEACFLLI